MKFFYDHRIGTKVGSRRQKREPFAPCPGRAAKEFRAPGNTLEVLVDEMRNHQF
jgi:hypothetical protein